MATEEEIDGWLDDLKSGKITFRYWYENCWPKELEWLNFMEIETRKAQERWRQSVIRQRP